MSTPIERVRAICAERNIPISRLEKDLGYGNGYFNPRKVTNIPSNRLSEIARYLNVTVDYLLGSLLYKRLKERREDLEFTQDELATELGYDSQNDIEEIESGRRELSDSQIESFAEALHTTTDYLQGWTDDYYDYDLDEDSRFAEIPLAQYDRLMEVHNGNLPAVWHAWCGIQRATEEEAMHENTPALKEGERKRKLRSVARLESADITPEMDKNITAFIDFLLQQKDENE